MAKYDPIKRREKYLARREKELLQCSIYRKKNKLKIKEWHKQHYLKFKCKYSDYAKSQKAIFARIKKYNLFKDFYLAQRKIYRLKNKDKIKSQLANWQKSGRGRIISYLHNVNYRAKKKSAFGNLDFFVFRNAWFKSKGVCAYCGALLFKVGFQLDHIIPLSKGGSNLAENIVCSCKYCNISKGNKDLIEWGVENGKLQTL